MLQSVTLFGLTINLFNFFNNAAVLGQIIVLVCFRREIADIAMLPKLANMYLKKKDSLLGKWGFLAIQGAVFILIVTTICNMAGNLVSVLFLGKEDANYFVNIFVAPLAVFLLSILFQFSPLKAMDLAAPTFAVSLVFYKIACFCWGCCNGVECERFGMLNHNTNRVEFPIQLVEIVCAVVMLTILLALLRKKNLRHGILYPLFMLMYCGSRFISEFWRDDYPDIWGPLKSYHIQCIIGFVEGAVFLFVVLKWGDRITAYFDSKNQALLDRHAEKIKTKKRQRRAEKPANRKKR